MKCVVCEEEEEEEEDNSSGCPGGGSGCRHCSGKAAERLEIADVGSGWQGFFPWADDMDRALLCGRYRYFKTVHRGPR